MIIGVTDTLGAEHKFRRYLDWLSLGNGQAEVVTLSYKNGNLDAVKRCDAVLLTGGQDVDPSSYHGPASHPRIIDVDKHRDDFEHKVLDEALKAQISILGICRGLQIANVHFGGTLIPDIEEAGYRSHRSASDDGECRHDMIVERDSSLSSMTGSQNGNVNSSHHQAVDLLGNGLRVAARSDDGIIEAIEFEGPAGRPFFLLVQWHPERMNDLKNPFAGKILEHFIGPTQTIQD